MSARPEPVEGRAPRSTVLQKRVRPPFLADRRVRSVSWMNDRIVAEREEDRANRGDQRVVIAARQIGAADRAGKQRVADEELLPRQAFFPDLETDAAGAMTRRVVRPHFAGAEPDDVARRVEHVDR